MLILIFINLVKLKKLIRFKSRIVVFFSLTERVDAILHRMHMLSSWLGSPACPLPVHQFTRKPLCKEKKTATGSSSPSPLLSCSSSTPTTSIWSMFCVVGLPQHNIMRSFVTADSFLTSILIIRINQQSLLAAPYPDISVQVQVSGACDSTWLKLATQERRTHSKDQVRWGVAFWKAIVALKSIADSPSGRGECVPM